jgi:hypothetical protein
MIDNVLEPNEEICGCGNDCCGCSEEGNMQRGESNTYKKAKREIDILLKTSTDDRPIIEEFIPEILALVNKFGNSGQSGGSAPYVANAISYAVKKLCMQEPICPLTGLEDEWSDLSDISDDPSFQNIRLPSVFKKKKDDRAYFLDAVIFQGEDDWDTFTGSVEEITSRQYIKSFPFTPKRFYIDVVREAYDPEKHKEGSQYASSDGYGDYVYKIKDRKQLEAVFQYYDQYKKGE